MIATDSPTFIEEDRLTRDLVRGLNEANPKVYWADLLVTSALGWAAFIFAVRLRSWSLGLLAAAALYRGLCFVHEISHQSNRSLPGFEAVWNLLIGYPLLLPSFVYVGVHQYHHKLSTYGTVSDPEYLPFARSRLTTVMFAFESVFIPVVLLVRFLLFSLVAFVSAALHRWLIERFSSLTINIMWKREVTPALSRAVRFQTAMILGLWSVFIGLTIAGVIPPRTFIFWLGVSAAISFVNTLRTLGAHAYESSGDPLDRAGQLADSIDTPGAVWTELWAPVGLRYHALHHYFPGIPYHNLAQAWQRLASTLPAEALYRQVASPGLAHSLRTLYRKGRR